MVRLKYPALPLHSVPGRPASSRWRCTSTGAVSIATGASDLEEGQMVLREGGPTSSCPLCGKASEPLFGRRTNAARVKCYCKMAKSLIAMVTLARWRRCL
ncbi:hypothetical protein FCH83_12225 [Pseudomonas putida]|nr:hypothetical protein [Pseudomonas putida]NTZ03946.1 hypothetical protein [Pseudomonas putida]NTZ24771.1 hypothetical protein [Pseudomonas putida]NTZ57287.1 hypothetical protein [Pseudomonas putida]NTZ68202.1 hypothetical protein [Pseudomonas putida]